MQNVQLLALELVPWKPEENLKPCPNKTCHKQGTQVHKKAKKKPITIQDLTFFLTS